ncbi:hypothetical protein BGX31_009313 [Mortierella sp. GBA43]|nr:hypothetical protein BGX31_009313 [Mortierella sp. GBA43]
MKAHTSACKNGNADLLSTSPHHYATYQEYLHAVESAEWARKHICPVPNCFKSFTRSSHLARHIRSHTSEKLFVCPVESCGLGFMRSDALREHARSHVARGSRSRKSSSDSGSQSAGECSPMSHSPASSVRSLSMSPYPMSPYLSESDEPMGESCPPEWARMTPINPTNNVEQHQHQQSYGQQQGYYRPTAERNGCSDVLQTPPYSPPMSPRYGSASSSRYASAPYPQYRAQSSQGAHPGLPSMMESTYHPHRPHPQGNYHHHGGYYSNGNGDHQQQQFSLPLPSISSGNNSGNSNSSGNGSDVRLPPISSLFP